MKEFLKKLNTKTATLIGVAAIAVVVIGVGAVYGLGGNRSADASKQVQTDTAQVTDTTSTSTQKAKDTKKTAKEKEATKESKKTKAAKATKKSTKSVETKTTSKTPKKDHSKTTKTKKDNGRYCKLTISCKTAVGNSDLSSSKKKMIPASGVIYSTKSIKFAEGDSVYDILRRETTKSGIHMESVKSPGYNTQYIKGIGNLYEFDCGELSGWMYKVNGSFPNYGCSQYKVKDGDNIQWLYSCDLGEDIGGRN